MACQLIRYLITRACYFDGWKDRSHMIIFEGYMWRFVQKYKRSMIKPLPPIEV
jgi:hypothetical protein